MLIGISVGCYFTILPLAVADVASNDIRGLLLVIFQLMFTLGSIFIYSLSLFFDMLVLATIGLISAIIFTVVNGVSPESPSFLVRVDCSLVFSYENSPDIFQIAKERFEEALSVMKSLRGAKYDCEEELSTLKLEREMIKQGLIVNPFKNPSDIKSFFTSLGVICLLHLSGGAIIITKYNNEIFKWSGFNTHELQDVNANLVTATTIALCNILALFMVECIGRRKLIIFSCGMMAFNSISLAICLSLRDSEDPPDQFLYLFFYGFFVVFFSIGLSPVAFVLYGELFRSQAQIKLAPIAMSVYFLINFILTALIQEIKMEEDNYIIFYLSAGFTVAATIFSYWFVPETRGLCLRDS